METLGRIREARDQGVKTADGEKAEVEVVFAHDGQWAERARKEGRFWPGKL